MKTRSALFWLLLATIFFACDPARKARNAAQDDGIIEITFLQMNDVYEIAPLSDNSGGLARVATLRKSLLAKNPNTFTVLAGDFISPSIYGTLKYQDKRIRGKQMIETLNTLGLDWVVLGNHEFDYGLEDLQSRLNESNFTWLTGNAQQKSGDHLHSFTKSSAGGEEKCPENLVVTVKDQDGTTIQLGVLATLITSGQKPYVQYADPFEYAQGAWTTLSAKTDLCVALTHLDVEDDKKLAAQLPAIPLVMGGHDHDNMLHKVGTTTIAKADANARTVYVHTLTHNKKTGKTTVESQLRKINGDIPDEPATAQVIKKWEGIMEGALSTAGFNARAKVIDLEAPLDCREAVVRHEQAPVGQLITYAMLAAAKKRAACAILNGGSIRVDDVLKGSLTELDVARMLPFGGGISEVEMQGGLLRKTLEAGRANKGKGGYLHHAQLEWDSDLENWVVNGNPLDDGVVYRVVLPNFLLTGLERNMGFLKAEPNAGGKGTTNSEINSISQAAEGDQKDLRRDIRLALIHFLRESK